MTTEKLISVVNELIERDKEYIQKLIVKGVKSGSMDIEGAPDNYILPKNLLCAIYKEMANQYAPLKASKQENKNVNNIYINL